MCARVYTRIHSRVVANRIVPRRRATAETVRIPLVVVVHGAGKETMQRQKIERKYRQVKNTAKMCALKFAEERYARFAIWKK